jgi:hypothetical protein
MKHIPLIVLTITVFLNKSYSQRVLKEYYDIFKTQIKEELQVNAYGRGHGFYKSYYQRGGFKETGFYTNGKATGLWSYYGEGASIPYEQWKYDNQGRKIMHKIWYQGGPDIGKLWEWIEWSQEETDDNGYPLITKHVLYTNNEVEGVNGDYYTTNLNIGYYMLYDLERRRTLPLEKRYFKEYYSNKKIRHQWIITKDRKIIETWYDENGNLTKKTIEQLEDNPEVVKPNPKIDHTLSIQDKYIVAETTFLFQEPDLFSNTLIEVEKGSIIIAKNSNSNDFKRVTHKGITGYIYTLTLSTFGK